MSTPLEPALRQELIEGVLEKTLQLYVLPERAEEIAAYVRGRVEQGTYETIVTGEALQEQLTEDLRHTCQDLHLRVIFHADPQPLRTAAAFEDEAWLREYWASAALKNHGVVKVERLPGNVGYFDLRAIEEAEETAPALAAAMALLSRTSALILDLRQNRGGAPSGVAFLCSYFVGPRPVHVNSVYDRTTDTTEQFWTAAYLPGPRYSGPLFVLTSAKTFSGGEEIAYNIQALKRGTLVGERTRGGAHPVDVFQIHPQLDLRLPVARAINPITGTNWEGVGVQPDLPCPAEEALSIAYRAALETIIDDLRTRTEQPYRELLEEAQQALTPAPD